MENNVNFEKYEKAKIRRDLIFYGGSTLLAILFGIGYIINDHFKNLEQKTQEEIVMDSTKIVNYAQPMDSIYKQLGIDETKYTQKELDSLVSEAYATIL